VRDALKLQDPKGYYKVLGVAPGASAEELRRAFRVLAKSCHPDKNADDSAAAQFRRLVEAYGVLSDLRTRAAYDGKSYEPPKEGARPREEKASARPNEASNSPPDELIKCACCNRPTAQPRQAVYWTVVSFMITWRKPTEGIYCAACADKVSLRCSAVSAAFGWWGLTGLFWTPIAIFRNARGGRRQEGSDARLLWHNARAFLAQGRPAVAHALARQVAASKSPYALDAADLLGELHRGGVARDTPPLVDPWRTRSASLALQAALGLAAPVIVAAAIGVYGLPTEVIGSPAYASALGPVVPAPFTATANAATAAAEARQAAVATCTHAPADGEVLLGELGQAAAAGHRLEITNGSDGPTIIKVRDADTGRVRVAFFVSQGGHADVGPLPDGAFRIQYAVGPTLAPDCKTFTTIASAAEFPNTETLKKEYREGSVVTQRLSYALRSVPDGRVRLQTIDRSKFLSE
jgi:curved DNA-binding protein CbpA